MSGSGRSTLYAFVVPPEYSMAAGVGDREGDCVPGPLVAAAGEAARSGFKFKFKSPSRLFSFVRSKSKNSLVHSPSMDALDPEAGGGGGYWASERERLALEGEVKDSAKGERAGGDGAGRLPRRDVVFLSYKEWVAELPVREPTLKPANYSRLDDTQKRRMELEYTYRELKRIG